MNKPVVVWQRGDLRIVAVDEEKAFVDEWKGSDDDEEDRPAQLVFERCMLDALDQPTWYLAEMHGREESDVVAWDLLLYEVASRNEILPEWVRRLVRERLESLDKVRVSSGGGAA